MGIQMNEKQKKKSDYIRDIIDALWLASSIAILIAVVVKIGMVSWVSGLLLLGLFYISYVLGIRSERKRIVTLLSKPEDKK